MNPFNNRFVQAVAALGVLATLALVTPRAAHAVAAALVQVTNTADNPAITQNAPTQAAQLVLLNATLGPNSGNNAFGSASASNGTVYLVPSDRSLVVTAVDLSPPQCTTAGNFTFTLKGNSQSFSVKWLLFAPNANTSHFEYPSGIVFPPGSEPEMDYAVIGSCDNVATANLFGYLTSN
jgi:hypothetical protein